MKFPSLKVLRKLLKESKPSPLYPPEPKVPAPQLSPDGSFKFVRRYDKNEKCYAATFPPDLSAHRINNLIRKGGITFLPWIESECQPDLTPPCRPLYFKTPHNRLRVLRVVAFNREKEEVYKHPDTFPSVRKAKAWIKKYALTPEWWIYQTGNPDITASVETIKLIGARTVLHEFTPPWSQPPPELFS